jgi:hypothetical protein
MIVTGNDTLFYASGEEEFYMSIDDGLTWQSLATGYLPLLLMS